MRVNLKFEASLDEASQARHHAQSGLFAADIDVAIIRITHKPVPTTLKLAIQLIQHEVRQQRRERTTLRRPLVACFEQPVRQHAGGQVASHQSKHPPVRDARRHASHQLVVIDPVEELRQVDIDDELIAFGDIGLRLCHRLMSGALRPEAVAVFAECRVPQRLQPLQHRLLDHAVNDSWHAPIELHSVATDLWGRLKSSTRFTHYGGNGLLF